jgi:ribokinase
MTRTPSIVVVGSVNLDLVATAARLPLPGETITGAELGRYPGGKGANQALAARRLGADVSLVACVGRDAAADEALALLEEAGVDLSHVRVDDVRATGVALIAVADSGENQIVVAPGANRALSAYGLSLPTADALICQLEVPRKTLLAAAEAFDGFVCVNLAPAMEVDPAVIRRADLIVVNESESAFYGDAVHGGHGLVALTHGEKGAELYSRGERVAAAAPPAVTPVDTTAAGDAFTAALTLALIEGMPREQALRFACTAGALATTRPGAQPSLPPRADVETLLR